LGTFVPAPTALGCACLQTGSGLLEVVVLAKGLTPLADRWVAGRMEGSGKDGGQREGGRAAGRREGSGKEGGQH